MQILATDLKPPRGVVGLANLETVLAPFVRSCRLFQLISLPWTGVPVFPVLHEWSISILPTSRM